MLDVGEHVPHAQHLGDVLKAGEAGVHPIVAGAAGVDLDLGDGLPERRRPAVEVLHAGACEQVGPQVAAHHVRLGDAVRDRGRGRERRDPRAVTGAEILELHVQVRARFEPVIAASRMFASVCRFLNSCASSTSR